MRIGTTGPLGSARGWNRGKMKKIIIGFCIVAGILVVFAAGFCCGVFSEKLRHVKVNYLFNFKPHELPTQVSTEPVNETFPCEELIRATKRERSPFHYDRETGEFQVLMDPIKTALGPRRGSYPLRYDPFTGRPLCTGRSYLFAKVTDQETERLFGLLHGAKTIEEAVSAIGKPDVTYGKCEYFRQDCTWSNLSTTALLSVQVTKDGRLDPMIIPKQIRQTIMDSDSNNTSDGIRQPADGSPKPSM